MFEEAPKWNRLRAYIPGRAMNLPSYHDMTTEDQDRVIAVVRGMLQGE